MTLLVVASWASLVNYHWYHIGGVAISDIGHMITLLSMVMIILIMVHSTYRFQVVSYHGNCVCL